VGIFRGLLPPISPIGGAEEKPGNPWTEDGARPLPAASLNDRESCVAELPGGRIDTIEAG